MTPTNQIRLSDEVRDELGELYVNHKGMVLKAAQRIIKRKEYAEDVLQNVFLRLIEMAADKPAHLDAFRKNPRAYLYKAAINEALHVKNGLSRQRVSNEDVEMLEILTPGPDSEQAEDIRRVRAAMETLDRETAELLHLHYTEGYTRSEIGKLQGKLAATVTVQLFRARNELKKALLTQERNHGTQETKIDRSDSAGFTEAFEA